MVRSVIRQFGPGAASSVERVSDLVGLGDRVARSNCGHTTGVTPDGKRRITPAFGGPAQLEISPGSVAACSAVSFLWAI